MTGSHLDGEYKRDLGKGLEIAYAEELLSEMMIRKRHRSLSGERHANNLYTNWLNYYVYQATPYDMIGTPDFR